MKKTKMIGLAALLTIGTACQKGDMKKTSQLEKNFEEQAKEAYQPIQKYSKQVLGNLYVSDIDTVIHGNDTTYYISMKNKDF